MTQRCLGPAIHLLGARIGACMNAFGTPLPYVKSARLRALGVVARERMPQLPDVATFAQLGYAGVDAYAWFGLVAPAGTPSPILERLNQEVNSVLKSNDVQERFASLGAIAVGGSAIEFERYLRNDLEKWARIVKQRHIKPD